MMLEEALKTLLGWFVMLPGFYLSGSLAGRFLPEADLRLRGIFYTAAGFMFLSFYLILAASVGQFNLWAVLLFFGITFAVRVSVFKNFVQWLLSMARYPWISEGTFLERCLAVVFYGTVFLTVGFALLPEIGNDALCYQLNVPKQFLWQGSLLPLEYDANSYMPMAMNLLYAVGLMLKSMGVSKIFHVMTGLLLTYVIALKVEQLTNHPQAARFSALMFWLAPVVVNEITTTYLDVATGFFLLIAFLWLYEAVGREKVSMVFMAGLAAGMTIAVKFSLLVTMPVITVVGFARWIWPMRFKKVISFAFVFCGAVFLGCGYWFVRNFILIGNPTFPYFGEIFNTLGFKNYATYMDVGVPKTLLNFILLPVHLVLNPKPFDHHYWVGPYLLLSVPALFVSIRNTAARPYLAIVFLLTGIWFLTTHAARYMLPMLPFWYIAAGAGLPYLAAGLKTKWAMSLRLRALIVISLTGCLLAAGAFHYRVQFLVLSGFWTPQQYLKKMERSYPAAEWVNQNLPREARILNVEEIRQFYFERKTVRESILYFFTKYTDGMEPVQILSFLKKHGFTHVMIAEGPARGLISGRVSVLVNALKNPEWFEFLDTVHSENIRDDRMSYTFYRIQ